MLGPVCAGYAYGPLHSKAPRTCGRFSALFLAVGLLFERPKSLKRAFELPVTFYPDFFRQATDLTAVSRNFCLGKLAKIEKIPCL